MYDSEQMSIIVSILSTLLTGGILSMYTESLHVSNQMAEKYRAVMAPFMHQLSNYFRFMSLAKSLGKINTQSPSCKIGVEYRNRINEITRYTFPCIMRDYEIHHFTAQQLNEIGEKINDIWYYWDKNHSQLEDTFEIYCNEENELRNLQKYLSQIFPNEIFDKKLSIELIARISSDFYSKIWIPINHIPSDNEDWLREERKFNRISFVTIVTTLASLFFILFLNNVIPTLFFSIATFICMLLLFLSILKMCKLYKYSQKIIYGL